MSILCSLMGVARFEGVWGGDNVWLENISNDFLGVSLDACVVDIFRASGADFVGGDTIFCWVDEGVKAQPEEVEGIGFEAAFKEGVLDTETVVFTVFGDTGEAFGMGYVVSDESEHLT